MNYVLKDEERGRERQQQGVDKNRFTMRLSGEFSRFHTVFRLQLTHVMVEQKEEGGGN